MSLAKQALTVTCVIGSATAAGAFLTFSTFTMQGLKALPPAQGIAAMQAINRHATTPVFMLILFGTGLSCAVLAFRCLTHLDEPAAKEQLLAAIIYLVGVVVITIGYHVPRNDHLAGLDPHSIAAADYWPTYLTQWVRMNHLRVIAPLATAVILAVSLTHTGSATRTPQLTQDSVAIAAAKQSHP